MLPENDQEENFEFIRNDELNFEISDQQEVAEFQWRWASPHRVQNHVENADVKSTKQLYFGSSKDQLLENYFKSLSRFKLLTLDEEMELGTRAMKADLCARQKLVISNLRLVLRFASRYKNRGIDFEDLVQEGNLGLIRAAQLYDPTKGTRFSTYACMWIIQFISRVVDNKARSIRLPIRVHRDIRAVRRIIDSAKNSSGLEPTVDQIVNASNLSQSRVQAALRNMVSPVSLNLETGIRLGGEIGDSIVYDDGISVESPIEQYLNESFVSSLMSNLTAFERELVGLRYGLSGSKEIGFKEISQRSGIRPCPEFS